MNLPYSGDFRGSLVAPAKLWKELLHESESVEVVDDIVVDYHVQVTTLPLLRLVISFQT